MFSKKKVGIIGTGDIARMMAKTLGGMKGVTCHAVASRTLEKAENFAKEFKIKNYYGSYEELCRDPKIELVYIATPHSEHYSNVKLALENGKNVLCEKAFTLNEKQAKELFELAKEKNLLLTEAMWTRFLPLAEKLREVLASNIIGDVSMVMADLSFNMVWKQRIQDPRLGGGALLDIGVYGITFASMVLGEDITDIQSLAVLNDAGMDIQDTICFKYRSGQMATITCSASSFGPCKGIIYGANGHIEVQDINNYSSITVYNNVGEKINFYKREKQITGYEYEVQAAFKALSEGWKECPEMPHSKTLKIMNIMDFIRNQTGVVFPQEKPDYTDAPSENQKDTDLITSAEESVDEAVTTESSVATAIAESTENSENANDTEGAIEEVTEISSDGITENSASAEEVTETLSEDISEEDN